MTPLTFDALRERSLIDEETGCWHLRASRFKGTTYLWVPQWQKAASLTRTIGLLIDGEKCSAQRMWVAMCGNTDCCNPKHRKRGGRALLMRVMRPTLQPDHRARIAISHRRRPTIVMTAAVRAEIEANPQETGKSLAARLGIHESTVSKFRLGESWAPLPGASVFGFRGSKP